MLCGDNPPARVPMHPDRHSLTVHNATRFGRQGQQIRENLGDDCAAKCTGGAQRVKRKAQRVATTHLLSLFTCLSHPDLPEETSP